MQYLRLQFYFKALHACLKFDTYNEAWVECKGISGDASSSLRAVNLKASDFITDHKDTQQALHRQKSSPQQLLRATC